MRKNDKFILHRVIGLSFDLFQQKNSFIIFKVIVFRIMKEEKIILHCKFLLSTQNV